MRNQYNKCKLNMSSSSSLQIYLYQPGKPSLNLEYSVFCTRAWKYRSLSLVNTPLSSFHPWLCPHFKVLVHMHATCQDHVSHLPPINSHHQSNPQVLGVHQHLVCFQMNEPKRKPMQPLGVGLEPFSQEITDPRYPG